MKKPWICFLCLRRYAELEEAELCERKHEQDKKKSS